MPACVSKRKPEVNPFRARRDHEGFRIYHGSKLAMKVICGDGTKTDDLYAEIMLVFDDGMGTGASINVCVDVKPDPKDWMRLLPSTDNDLLPKYKLKPLKGSWAAGIEDMYVRSFKAATRELLKFESSNPDLVGLHKHCGVFEPEVRRLVKRALIHACILADDFMDSVVEHCWEDLMLMRVDEVHSR